VKIGDLVRNPFGGVGIVIELASHDVRNVHAHFPDWGNHPESVMWTGWMCQSHLEVIT